MYVYTCPGCDAQLKSAQPAPAGKQIKCRACGTAFTPKATAPKAGTAAPTGKKKPAAVPAAAADAPPEPFKYKDPDADESPYKVIKEEDTEAQKEAKELIKFDGVIDKGKRSARGPAMSLLVFPSNLLIAEGVLTFIGGIGVFLWAMWPVVFVEVSPSDEEYIEQAVWMMFGVMLLVWGSLICLGASKMQNLESYTWGMVGAVLGILPLLVGIFAIAMLRNPKVIAGFEEMEGAVDEDEDEDEEDDDEDDEDDEDD